MLTLWAENCDHFLNLAIYSVKRSVFKSGNHIYNVIQLFWLTALINEEIRRRLENIVEASKMKTHYIAEAGGVINDQKTYSSFISFLTSIK